MDASLLKTGASAKCGSASTSLIYVELHHPSIAWVDLEVVRGGRKGAAALPLVFEYEFHLYGLVGQFGTKQRSCNACVTQNIVLQRS